MGFYWDDSEAYVSDMQFKWGNPRKTLIASRRVNTLFDHWAAKKEGGDGLPALPEQQDGSSALLGRTGGDRVV